MSKLKELPKTLELPKLPKLPKSATHVVTVNDVYEAYWAAEDQAPPDFDVLPEVAREAYADGVAHVSAGNEPRTKFEQFFARNANKSTVDLGKSK